MTRTQSLAGRPVPAWAGAFLRILVLVGMLALALQLTRLQASPNQAAPEAPAAPAANAAPAPAPAPAPRPALTRLTLDRPLVHGDYAWTEQGVPPGRLWILVDLSTQTLSVFRAGHEIGRAVILYGTEENPTPLGTFAITEKKVYHESNLYEAIMPFMMRLTDDGIAVHGSNVRYGWASRGCIGVPDEFAALLFEQARIGDRVTIVDGNPPSAPPAA